MQGRFKPMFWDVEHQIVFQHDIFIDKTRHKTVNVFRRTFGVGVCTLDERNIYV